MQFPVPQFTDVEDKIIGPLSVKQFGILFGAGVVVFLPYSVTKSVVVLIVFGALVGLPAIFLAFGSINGRPMYKSIGYFLEYTFSPKVLVFHKEPLSSSVITKARNEKVEIVKQKEVSKPSDPRARLKEVQMLLAKKGNEEKELLKNIK